MYRSAGPQTQCAEFFFEPSYLIMLAHTSPGRWCERSTIRLHLEIITSIWDAGVDIVRQGCYRLVQTTTNAAQHLQLGAKRIQTERRTVLHIKTMRLRIIRLAAGIGSVEIRFRLRAHQRVLLQKHVQDFNKHHRMLEFSSMHPSAAAYCFSWSIYGRTAKPNNTRETAGPICNTSVPNGETSLSNSISPICFSNP